MNAHVSFLLRFFLSMTFGRSELSFMRPEIAMQIHVLTNQRTITLSIPNIRQIKNPFEVYLDALVAMAVLFF